MKHIPCLRGTRIQIPCRLDSSHRSMTSKTYTACPPLDWSCIFVPNHMLPASFAVSLFESRLCSSLKQQRSSPRPPTFYHRPITGFRALAVPCTNQKVLKDPDVKVIARRVECGVRPSHRSLSTKITILIDHSQLSVIQPALWVVERSNCHTTCALGSVIYYY